MGSRNWTSRESWSVMNAITSVGQAVQVVSLSQGLFTKTNQVTYGLNYADWKRSIARGLQTTTSMYYTGSTVTKKRSHGSGSRIMYPTDPPLLDGTPVFWEIDSRGSSVGFPTTGFHLDNGNPVPLSDANTQAMMNFLNNVRSKQTSFQGGVFLGEIRETVHLLKHPAQSLRKGLSGYLASLKKKKRLASRLPPSSRRKLLQQIASDTWLEFAFGVKPLIHDINDAAKTLANHVSRLHGPVDSMVIGSSTNIIADPPGNYTFSLTNGPVSLFFNVRHLWKYYVKYYGKVALESPGKLDWRMAGFSLDNFLPTAWELIPWSFLSDYFVNIGDLIYAATTNLSSLKWTSSTSVEEEMFEVVCSGVKSDLRLVNGQFVPIAQCSFQPGKTVLSNRRIRRGPFNGPFVPPLTFKMPGVSSTKWINMGALAAAHRGLKPYR